MIEFNQALMQGWLKIELSKLDADARLPASKKVYCPPRAQVLSLEECAACEHCTGCIIDTGSDTWALRCEHACEGQEPNEQKEQKDQSP